MQFHLNGFRPGDPHVFDASPQVAPRQDATPAQVDVLIVGCGPAGLTLAAQLAAFPDINCQGSNPDALATEILSLALQYTLQEPQVTAEAARPGVDGSRPRW